MRIDVVDNHGQFTHLEGRALRDIGVETETIDNETPPGEVDADGLVLSVVPKCLVPGAVASISISVFQCWESVSECR